MHSDNNSDLRAVEVDRISTLADTQVETVPTIYLERTEANREEP